MKLKKAHRWSRRLLIPLAALPLTQISSCADPLVTFASSFVNSTLIQIVSNGASAFAELLLQAFPGSNILRGLLTGNIGFFP